MCVHLFRCEKAFGGLYGPPEQLGSSSRFPKLLATFGGEAMLDQGPGALFETAVRAGLPVKQRLLNGITTLTSLAARACPLPSSEAPGKSTFLHWKQGEELPSLNLGVVYRENISGQQMTGACQRGSSQSDKVREISVV